MIKLFVNGEEVDPAKKGKALSLMSRAELDKLINDELLINSKKKSELK